MLYLASPFTMWVTFHVVFSNTFKECLHLSIRRYFHVHATANFWMLDVICGISHSLVVLWPFQPCSSVWNSTLSLNSLQIFCLKQCLWSLLLCITPSAICQLGFLSLSFSVLCISGRLNSPFLSKQSCDPEPFRSPVRQASPLRARGT